jgi:hypothetical protein
MKKCALIIIRKVRLTTRVYDIVIAVSTFHIFITYSHTNDYDLIASKLFYSALAIACGVRQRELIQLK